jgi:hypothetical protein
MIAKMTDLLEDIKKASEIIKQYRKGEMVMIFDSNMYNELQKPIFIRPPRIVDPNRRPRFMPRWKWYFLKWFDRFREQLSRMKWRQDGCPPRSYFGFLEGFRINDDLSRLIETACEPMYHGPKDLNISK